LISTVNGHFEEVAISLWKDGSASLVHWSLEFRVHDRGSYAYGSLFPPKDPVSVNKV
jgi:hypothetical protein